MSEALEIIRGLPHRLSARREDLKLLGCAALLNALLFGFVLATLTPYYETNDDLNMQLISSGFYTGQPSEHLVFTNVLIGWALRILYGYWHGYNWYFVYLMVVHYLALTAFAFLILSRRSRWTFVLLYVGFFLVAEIRILLNLQFTTTAFLAGTVGVLLLGEGLRPGHPVHWLKTIAGVALIALMGMIREPVVMFLALVAFPFLVERFGVRGWRRLLAAGLVCAGLFLGLQGINRWYYQRDPAWAEFSEYNRLHGQIRVTPIKNSISKVAPAVGWSQNDAWMFSNWYFSDPEVFGATTRLRLLVEKLKSEPRAHPFSGRLFTICLFLPKALGSDAGLLLKIALLSAAGCLYFAGAQRTRCFFTLIVLYGLFGLLTFYLLDKAYLPQRVAYNMPLFMLSLCLYWASGFRGDSTARTSYRGLGSAPWLARFPRPAIQACLLAGFLFWVVLSAPLLLTWIQSLAAMNGANYYLKTEISPKAYLPLTKLLPPGKKPILIPVNFETPLEQSLFFHSLTEQIPFTLMPYSWVAQSPVFQRVLDQHQLTPYSLSLVDRPDVFFSMAPNWVEPLRTFYREHYGLEVRFDLVLNTDKMPEYVSCQLNLYQAHAVPGNVPRAERPDGLPPTTDLPGGN